MSVGVSKRDTRCSYYVGKGSVRDRFFVVCSWGSLLFKRGPTSYPRSKDSNSRFGSTGETTDRSTVFVSSHNRYQVLVGSPKPFFLTMTSTD